jgi:hypothetical protein
MTTLTFKYGDRCQPSWPRVEPDDLPAVVGVTWPLQPSIVDPKQFGDTAGALVRMSSTAHVELARIKARRHRSPGPICSARARVPAAPQRNLLHAPPPVRLHGRSADPVQQRAGHQIRPCGFPLLPNTPTPTPANETPTSKTPSACSRLLRCSWVSEGVRSFELHRTRV